MASVESVAAPADEVVTIGTWLRFLFGSREAILRVARSRQALWLGLAFVLSAGFAREYDGADLWHEPWHLALPLVASLGTSLILWTIVFLTAANRGLEKMDYWSGYRTLLTYYWLTAPLAWIYAIPVERLMPPGDAMAANFWFLGLVSLWRVLLITRALSVWLSANFFAMFFLVAFFADTVAILLAVVSPMPIFNVMGGIRHSAVDRVVLNVILGARFYGIASWLIWLVGAIVVMARRSPWSLPSGDATARVSRPLWAFAGSLVVCGIFLLRVGQAEQQHAYETTRLLQANELDAAIEYMSKYPRDAFPPIWDPPPRIGYGEFSPPLVDIFKTIQSQDPPAWVREVFVSKLTQDPRSTFNEVWPRGEEGNTEKLSELLGIYEEFVPAASLDRQQWDDLYMMIEHRPHDTLRQQFRDYLMKDRKPAETADQPPN